MRKIYTMATQLFAQTETQLDTYLPAYKNIMSAIGFVNLNTGETIKLSAEQKIVWLYILDRYKFFKEKGQLYFDNQSDIALACGVSERTVLRFINALSNSVDEEGKHVGSGYLQINQTRIGGHKSNSYTILSDLVLVQPEKTSNKPIQARTEQTNGIAAPAVQNAIEGLTGPSSDDSYIPAGQDWAFESITYDELEPQWVVTTQEDDGSMQDALTFNEEILSKTEHKNDDQGKDVPKPTLKKESNFSSAFHKDLPSKRFNPNGSVSSEMLNFCAQNNIAVTEINGSALFVVDGKEYEVGKNGFVPASPGAIKAMEIALPF
ncbi:MAG: helix-turn-helix domain-containing protein [Aquipseudomonas alcaligenes]|uniref:Helix-turn-helix domain-containing protein n=1 Tax=Aquipseudomonas alcaligenes TaxID=43263 RepID=A0A5C7WB13_AQUAC|nr:MAG: helix-turn-helix domain-containing protein [Pseudomonas alcaligenes]